MGEQKTPVCPGCGKLMKIHEYTDHTGLRTNFNARYFCPECTWAAPLVSQPYSPNGLREMAAKAANRRMIQKPMTPEEVKKLPNGESVYIEHRCADERRGGYADVYQWPDYLVAYYCGCQSGECLHFDKHGKSWMCWDHKPTEEECEAAPWEED